MISRAYRSSRATAGPSNRCVRILCVDDNQDLADSEALLLQLFGFETIACYDGSAALEALRSFQPDICLIDLNMPRMCGDELVQRMRTEKGQNELPLLVALTARDDPESCRRIELAGFDRHFIKPLQPDRLLALLNEFQQASGSAAPFPTPPTSTSTSSSPVAPSSA